MKRLISVVVPIFNEEVGIKDFLLKQLVPILNDLKYEVEIVLVNDGSRDKTMKKIEDCVGSMKNTKLIVFTRNFGKEIALTAGIQNAKGDAVILVDADGQHPVEMIPKMITRWEAGAKVVIAVREHNTTRHRLGSKIYYATMRMLGNKNIVVGAMDFRLIDRCVVDEFNKMTERNRLTRGLIDWLGFDQEYIKVKTKGRVNGKPTYSVKKLTGLAVDGLVSASRTPLVIFGYLGVFITVVSVLLGLFILIQQYVMGDPLHLDWSGAVAMSVFISFLVGLVLISQAITALYISQIHVESKNRPLYIIDKEKSLGLDEEDV